jgi:hypothetical protein
VRVALVPQLDLQVPLQARTVPYDERLEGRDATELRASHELGVLGLDVRVGVTVGRSLWVRHHYIVAQRREKVPSGTHELAVPGQVARPRGGERQHRS